MPLSFPSAAKLAEALQTKLESSNWGQVLEQLNTHEDRDFRHQHWVVKANTFPGADVVFADSGVSEDSMILFSHYPTSARQNSYDEMREMIANANTSDKILGYSSITELDMQISFTTLENFFETIQAITQGKPFSVATYLNHNSHNPGMIQTVQARTTQLMIEGMMRSKGMNTIKLPVVPNIPTALELVSQTENWQMVES